MDNKAHRLNALRKAWVFALHVACWGGMMVVGTLLSAVPLGAGQEGGDASYKHLTLDEVARTGHEVSYEEVADAYGGPMSRAPVVSVKAHPELVWVRPDMGIGMVANPIAFGVDSPPGPIRWQRVERSLKRGYLPIVISRYRDGGLMYEQVAYATLLDGGEVKTGHEKQVVMVRMSVVNTDPAEKHRAAWWAYVPATVATTDGLPYFWSYNLFEVTGSLPAVPEQALKEADDILREGSKLLGVYEEGPGVKVTRYEKVLKFELELLPGQKKSVNLKISSNKKGFTSAEIERLRKLDFFSALDQEALELEGILARGMKIQVPEEIVNNIYKAQILYNQTQMVQAADRDFYVPVQGSRGFWPWEQMKQLTALDAFGYHEDVQKSLGYYLKLQGKRPPNAKVKTFAGAIPSSATFEESGWEKDSDSTIYGLFARQMAGKESSFPNWVSNTGSSLNAFAEHYFYTKDRRWLEAVAPAMIKACDWIIESRQLTKARDAQGHKVLHYGLMPAGQPYDTEAGQEPDYYYCITDGYTSQGFTRVAEALADINHPDGARLMKEAESYRQDVLEVMRRVRRTDPNLPAYPEHLNGPDGWGSFVAGQLSLVDSGLIDPKDPVFEQIESYMKKHFNHNVLGLSGRCHADDIGRANTSYYMTTTEDVYHYGWATRGEVEKALLSFYSALVFGVDKDTLGAIERFSLYDQRYAPFFIDSSGGMRIANMIRRAILLEKESELHLLSAAPRRWLEADKRIEVVDAPTYFGSMDLHVESQVNEGKIVAELVLRKNNAALFPKVVLRLPHPTKQSMKQVTVNGKPWKDFSPQEEVIELKPVTGRYRVVAQY